MTGLLRAHNFSGRPKVQYNGRVRLRSRMNTRCTETSGLAPASSNGGKSGVLLLMSKKIGRRKEGRYAPPFHETIFHPSISDARYHFSLARKCWQRALNEPLDSARQAGVQEVGQAVSSERCVVTIESQPLRWPLFVGSLRSV
jgi:hypothetical protein